jgi:hypothetical protein
MFAWLYDYRLDGDSISFVLLRAWTVHVMAATDIDTVREVGYFSIGAWNAYNLKNRFSARTFMLTLRRGWFARKLLLTPADPAAFTNWCVRHNLSIAVTSQ